MLAKIARILRQNRIDVGALTLSSPEVRFKLDADDDNHPTDVCMYQMRYLLSIFNVANTHVSDFRC
jgi:exoribonuclease R